MKTCPNCGNSGTFYKDKSKKDGLSSWCKSCSNKRSKKWRDDNPGKAKKHLQEWQIKNPGKRKKYDKKYWENNREQINKRISEWAKSNPEKRRLHAKNRKYQIKGSRGNISIYQWKELCGKYNNRCLCCGKQTKLTIDHIIPISRGGDNCISNIQPLCNSCNASKGVKIIDYRPNKSNPQMWLQRELL